MKIPVPSVGVFDYNRLFNYWLCAVIVPSAVLVFYMARIRMDSLLLSISGSFYCIFFIGVSIEMLFIREAAAHYKIVAAVLGESEKSRQAGLRFLETGLKTAAQELEQQFELNTDWQSSLGPDSNEEHIEKARKISKEVNKQKNAFWQLYESVTYLRNKWYRSPADLPTTVKGCASMTIS
tara:strand:- start:1081 stop:1620 length:540 start_codon:yes stop_codon:yes gene_type:complete